MPQDYDQVEDFLTDESFVNWYFKSNEKDVLEWNQWIKGNPSAHSMIREAVAIFDSVKINDTKISQAQVVAAEARLMANDKLNPRKKNSTQAFTQTRWLKYAAAIIMLLISGIVVRSILFSRAKINTEFGEIKSKILPDGSEVLLNANTQLTYSEHWKQGEDREVWIKGEAFFQVTKTPNKTRFIVHASQFDIYVTGTRFNVMNRDDKSNVLLQEGQVILRREEGKDIVMAPGDFLEFNDDHLQKKRVNAETVTAWKERKINFDNTLLSDAVELIRQHYGVTVRLEDENLGRLRLTGILPNDNLDVLIEALAALNEFRVIKNKEGIEISKLNSN